MDNKKLIETVATKMGKGKEEIAHLTDCLSDAICDTLKEGDAVAIPSVGTFETKMRAERTALHPASGKRLLIPPKISVIFKPSLLLKQRLR